MSSVENQFFIWEEKNLTEPLRNCENKAISVPNDTTINTEKNVIKNQWKDTGKISGIYKIINKVNGKYYIGSTNNTKRRWWEHKFYLNHNKHLNPHLQHAWNKYGEDNFEWVVVEEVPKEKLIEVEQKYLDMSKDKCYNMSLIAGRIEMTDEIRQKIGHAQKLFYGRGGVNCRKGKKLSEKTKQLLSSIKKGKPLPLETLKRSKESSTGKNNKRYNHTIFKWYNSTTNETFEGTQHDFYTKYKFLSSQVNEVSKGKRNLVHGWRCKNPPLDKYKSFSILPP